MLDWMDWTGWTGFWTTWSLEHRWAVLKIYLNPFENHWLSVQRADRLIPCDVLGTPLMQDMGAGELYTTPISQLLLARWVAFANQVVGADQIIELNYECQEIGVKYGWGLLDMDGDYYHGVLVHMVNWHSCRCNHPSAIFFLGVHTIFRELIR